MRNKKCHIPRHKTIAKVSEKSANDMGKFVLLKKLNERMIETVKNCEIYEVFNSEYTRSDCIFREYSRLKILMQFTYFTKSCAGKFRQSYFGNLIKNKL